MCVTTCVEGRDDRPHQSIGQALIHRLAFHLPLPVHVAIDCSGMIGKVMKQRFLCDTAPGRWIGIAGTGELFRHDGGRNSGLAIQIRFQRCHPGAVGSAREFRDAIGGVMERGQAQ